MSRSRCVPVHSRLEMYSFDHLDVPQTSTQLLTELSAFLSTFQHDLSAVSGHISELQGRSKTIEARLEARKVRDYSILATKPR